MGIATAIEARLRRVSVASACLPIGVGLIAFVGWTLGLSALTQFFSARSAMQPVTALCAILQGAGIVAAAGPTKRFALARVLALLVIVVAVQTLLQFVSGRDFGTDHLLFAARVNAQPVHYAYPGRMAAPSATAFLLVASGCCLAA